MTASREPSRKKPKEAQQEEVSRTPDTHLHPAAAAAAAGGRQDWRH